MRQIDPQRLYEILYADRLRHWRMLQHMESQKGDFDFFTNDNETCFSIVHRGNSAYFVGYDSMFTEEVLVRHPARSLSYGFNFHLLPGQRIPPEIIHDVPIGKPTLHFFYEGNIPVEPIDPHIRILAGDDIDMAKPFINSHDSRRNKLKELNAKAFAWLEEEQIKACVSCIRVFEGCWEPFFYSLHLPKHLKQEITAALFYAYLKTIREQGDIPTINNVYLAEANDPDQVAALKAGFLVYKTSYWFWKK